MRSPLSILLWKIGGAFVPFMVLLTVPVHGIITLNVGLIASVIIWSNLTGYLEGRSHENEK
jgi:hypothetical protein